jgi:hypothetical protein
MKSRKSLLDRCIFLLQVLFFVFFFTLFFFPDKLNIHFQSVAPVRVNDPFIIRLCKVVIWLSSIILSIHFYRIIFIRKKSSELLTGVGLSILTLFVSFVLIEIAFMFIPKTHGVDTTKASILWVDKFYKPINSLGYRDKEPSVKTDKKVILFVGDSFTAGYGNDYVNERFSDIVYHHLDSTRYEVYNMGVPGIDTKGEVEKLKKFPVKPDVIVLAYFFNDIEEAAADHGFRISVPAPYSGVPKVLRPMVTRLYFPNFVYWHLPGKSNQILDDFLNKTYKNPEILQTHLNDLSKIVEYRDEVQAKMIAVMIPFLVDLNYSSKFTSPISEFLIEKGVKVLTLEEELSKLSVRDRVVNSTDSHASFKANEIIAQKILTVFKQEELLE